jgi:hypothetical protein
LNQSLEFEGFALVTAWADVVDGDEEALEALLKVHYWHCCADC